MRASGALLLALALGIACSYDFERYAAPSEPVEAEGGEAGSANEGGTSAGNVLAGGAGESGGKGGVSGASATDGSGGSAGQAATGSGGVSAAGEAGSDSNTAGASGAASSFDCEAVFGTTFDGHCYFIVGTDSGLTFEGGSARCAESDGAHLVTIGSLAEHDALVSAFFPSTDDYWIGLSMESAPSDPPSECSFLPVLCPFEWVTGEPLEFTNWLPRDGDEEPNYSGACARIRGADQAWADFTCSTALPAICEHD